MNTFEVMDMTCGHCVSAITQAVKAVDPQALVQVDLATHRVVVDQGQGDVQALRRAISDAGYTPVPVA
jgi:copper chaperone